jgi:hypothetical protein
MSRLVSDIPISLHIIVLIAKFKRKEIPAKPLQTLLNHGKKAKQLTRIDKIVRFLEADEWS